ncbi:MAG: LptF/LptG family permease [Bacteroidetes bacterium]|nr:LptF/LptG family permease [Bacteroidota bacterium]
MKIAGFKLDLSPYLAPFAAVVLVAMLVLLVGFPAYCEASIGIHKDAILMAIVFDVACLSLFANRLQIHKLILKSFVGPFLIAFSVILFILVLQFMAKYQEDIVGKGLESSVLAKVFGLACLTLVTMALPLGVLLSSLLTLGNMGERYELAALKSGGVGLFKAIRPLIHATLVVMIGSMFFSFFIAPMSNLKLYTLLYDLSKVKPTFALKPNHFYNGLDGMVVHVGEINRETDILSRVKIFDHRDQVGNNRITMAARGKMVPSESTGYLDMTLFNGEMFERQPNEGGGPKSDKTQIFSFDTLMYKVPLQGFNLEQSDEETFSNHHFMLNIIELGVAVDSMAAKGRGYLDDYADFNRKHVHLDTTLNNGMREMMAKDSVVYGPNGVIAADVNQPVSRWFPEMQPKDLLTKTLNQVQAMENYSRLTIDRSQREEEKLRKFVIEQHYRWMLPVSCIVFLFLGASLGAIIRKGGIGVPVIFSIVFFILFYILMIQGKKFARDEILPLWVGVWLPVLVMLPMAIFFTWQSATESTLLYGVSWYKIVRKLFGWLPIWKKKGVQRHTMSVEELIALREKSKTDARRAIEEHESKK